MLYWELKHSTSLCMVVVYYAWRDFEQLVLHTSCKFNHIHIKVICAYACNQWEGVGSVGKEVEERVGGGPKREPGSNFESKFPLIYFKIYLLCIVVPSGRIQNLQLVFRRVCILQNNTVIQV